MVTDFKVCRPNLAIRIQQSQMCSAPWLQVVLESPGVNTYVSGPAAAMALMLMYLKTGDTNVAAKFKVSRQCVVRLI